MTRSRTLTRTDPVMAGRGAESQDSQVILDALKAELGVPTLSGSPSCPDPPGANEREDVVVVGEQTASLGREAIGHAGTVVGSQSIRPPIVDAQQNSLHQAVDDASPNECMKSNYEAAGREELNLHHPREPALEHELDDGAVVLQSSPIVDYRVHNDLDDTQAYDASDARHPIEKSTFAPAPGYLKPPLKKMEISQGTPTQLNEDRDYDKYCHPAESSPLADTFPQTLRDDDTGAVNFGNLDEGLRPSSQVSEDGGFENTRGDWRRPDNTSQLRGQTPFRAGNPVPSTPAASKNPFGPRQTASAPFAGSQLFGQTQLLTSAVKAMSPTSSRPSPNALYDSVSPHIMRTSPLKNRTNVSSPTDIRSSSPQRLHELPATATKRKLSPVEDASPSGSRLRNSLTAKSPSIKALKSSPSRQPRSHYEPMRKSQERKSALDVKPIAWDNVSDSDDDPIVAKLERQKRVARKKAQAAKEMEKVSFVRPTKREVDSPSKKRRKLLRDVEEDVVVQESPNDPHPITGGIPDIASPIPQPNIVASPEEEAVGSTKATPGDDGEGQVPGNDYEMPNASVETADEEMIPATSPVRSMSVGNPVIASASEPELPVLEEEVKEKGPDGGDTQSSSQPMIRRRATRTYARRTQRQNPYLISSAPSEPPVVEVAQAERLESCGPSSTAPAMGSNNSVTDETRNGKKKSGLERDVVSSPPKPRPAALLPLGARSRKTEERAPLTPKSRAKSRPPSDASSSVTALSTTPAVSVHATPDTETSPASERDISLILPSPVGIRGRKKSLRQSIRAESPQPLARVSRTEGKATRIDSESTDELQRSPTSSAVSYNMAPSKFLKAHRQSIAPSFRGRRLFEGMVFALSMQAEQPKRTSLESKIIQAGGTILQDGFQELFEPSALMSAAPTVHEPAPLKLTKASLDYGFTALIADGHSRKAKYMQALALGVPCLAYQWVTACLTKGSVVDWEPYLLASGSSPVLGDAVKSRSLQSYAAADARLHETIERRPKLLEGENLLVVLDMKKSKKEVKKPYIFLAETLGASIHRVTTAQQARERLQLAGKSDESFHWIYLDKSVGTMESLLSASEPKGKRRRRSAGTSALTNVRVLHDELVIQSLILGRVVDEDEMTF